MRIHPFAFFFFVILSEAKNLLSPVRAIPSLFRAGSEPFASLRTGSVKDLLTSL